MVRSERVKDTNKTLVFMPYRNKFTYVFDSFKRSAQFWGGASVIKFSNAYNYSALVPVIITRPFRKVFYLLF